MVMDGAGGEDDVIIGAGSLVPPGNPLKSGHLYVGRPVKEVRELSDKGMSFFTYTAGNYVKLKDMHLEESYNELQPAQQMKYTSSGEYIENF